MEKPEHYEADVLHFFDGKDLEREIYEALFARMDAAFPDGRVQVQSTCRGAGTLYWQGKRAEIPPYAGGDPVLACL